MTRPRFGSFCLLLTLFAALISQSALRADGPSGDPGTEGDPNQGKKGFEITITKASLDTYGAKKLKVVKVEGTWTGVNGATKPDITKITVSITYTEQVEGGQVGVEAVSQDVPAANINSTNAGQTTGTWNITIPEPAFAGPLPNDLTIRATILPNVNAKGTTTTPYPKQ